MPIQKMLLSAAAGQADRRASTDSGEGRVVEAMNETPRRDRQGRNSSHAGGVNPPEAAPFDDICIVIPGSFIRKTLTSIFS
jgi:hypothetical protein